jgi:hypothetical protein
MQCWPECTGAVWWPCKLAHYVRQCSSTAACKGAGMSNGQMCAPHAALYWVLPHTTSGAQAHGRCPVCKCRGAPPTQPCSPIAVHCMAIHTHAPQLGQGTLEDAGPPHRCSPPMLPLSAHAVLARMHWCGVVALQASTLCETVQQHRSIQRGRSERWMDGWGNACRLILGAPSHNQRCAGPWQVSCLQVYRCTVPPHPCSPIAVRCMAIHTHARQLRQGTAVDAGPPHRCSPQNAAAECTCSAGPNALVRCGGPIAHCCILDASCLTPNIVPCLPMSQLFCMGGDTLAMCYACMQMAVPRCHRQNTSSA